MSEKAFKTIEQQIEILKSRNLSFPNEDDANRKLRNHGYYEITGYRDLFREDPSDKDNENFKSGTSFDDIFALYYLDYKIRIAVYESLEFAENFIKQRLAYTLGENHGENQCDYINERVFKAGRDHSGRYQNQREFLFHKIQTIVNLNYDPYAHYLKKYGNVPPWILVKGMDLGTLILTIKLLKDGDKQDLVNRIYNPEKIKGKDKDTAIKKILFAQTLDMIRKYRNRASHVGRMYNYFPDGCLDFHPSIYIPLFISEDQLSERKIHKISLNILSQSLSLFQTDYPHIFLQRDISRAFIGYRSAQQKWNSLVDKILKQMELPKSFLLSEEDMQIYRN